MYVYAEKETFILRSWLTWLWTLANLKSTGSAEDPERSWCHSLSSKSLSPSCLAEEVFCCSQTFNWLDALHSRYGGPSALYKAHRFKCYPYTRAAFQKHARCLCTSVETSWLIKLSIRFTLSKGWLTVAVGSTEVRYPSLFLSAQLWGLYARVHTYVTTPGSGYGVHSFPCKAALRPFPAHPPHPQTAPLSHSQPWALVLTFVTFREMEVSGMYLFMSPFFHITSFRFIHRFSIT